MPRLQVQVRLLTRATNALILAVGLSSCAPRPARRPECVPPTTEIRGERTVDGLTFRFTNCRTGTIVPILSIYVTSVDETGNDELILCSVKEPSEGADERALGKRWVYGTHPANYAVRGCRGSLAPGTYRIHASGSGMGARTFEIEQDGTLQWTTRELCPAGSEL